jgi:hypothetical protein
MFAKLQKQQAKQIAMKKQGKGKAVLVHSMKGEQRYNNTDS